MDTAALLERDGLLARRMPQYESRPQQREMALAVARAFTDRKHLLVEAGTGVGKTFAYLLPAIGQVTRHNKRVVVSTHTIALQEQLINKDLPFLRAALPDEFTAVLVKGRSNYIGLRRLAMASRRQISLFEREDDLDQLHAIEDWAYHTEDGSLADLPVLPAPGVWERVRSEHGNCMGRRCEHYEKCFYQQARRRAANARLLVVNHALFFSDLALRRNGASLIPDYDFAILDEAHMVEPVAGDHFGLSLADTQVRYLLNSLYNERNQKGTLAAYHAEGAVRAVTRAKQTAARFFEELLTWQKRHGRSNGRFLEPPPVRNALSPALREVHQKIRAVRSQARDEEDRFELNAQMDQLAGFADLLSELLEQKRPGWVYWLETSGASARRIELNGRPIDVSAALSESLFGAVPSVVLTSATLSTGRSRDFSYLKSRLGLDQCTALSLGSPFDYRAQAELHLAPNMPDPGNAEAFIPAACAAIERYLVRSDGRAFVLFTSYDMMNRCAERLKDFFIARRMTVMVQGQGMNRSAMLERFKSEVRSVIFGTDSFWAGVDVPGEALSNVIIVKLPFDSPDRPLVEARIEQMRAEGKSPFMEYQLPEAVLKFKQGFGRLIRTKTDRGMVVVLDPRLRTKPYGRAFLEALPELPVIENDSQPAAARAQPARSGFSG